MANSKKKSAQNENRTKAAGPARPEAPEAPAKAEASPKAARSTASPSAASSSAESPVATNPTAQPPPGPGKGQARAETPNRTTPTQEQVARRAYQIFQARGGQHGRHTEDWVQAEQELKLGTQ
jgi:Protein of unknown function (DUF2934)